MSKYFDDALDDPLLFERCESFGGGMDSYRRATLLDPDQFQFGENMIVTENLLKRTRPGADRLGNQFTKQIQGLFYFDTPSLEQLIAACDTAFYKSGGGAWTAINGFALAGDTTAFSAAQGVDKLLVTGGAAGALGIWDGTNWTSTTNIHDPPTGATIVLWHAGRMWASGFPGGTAGKEDDAVCASALGQFGAGDWDLIDRSFRVGKGEGDPVLGLVSMPASVPEQAVLGVLKQNSINLVRTDPTQPIAQYSNTVNPEVVAGGLGVVGKRAFAVLGNDLLYVSPDRSFRSLARMEAAASQYAVGPALSVPLQPYMDRVNWDYAYKIAVTRYQQLALFSVPLDASTYPNTVFVWNGRLQRWVGVWTGWTPNCWEVSRFGGIHQLIHGDNVGNVRQWKDLEDQNADDTYKDDGAGYVSKFDSRAFLFQEPFNPKNARYAECVFGLSNGLVNISLVADNATVATWQKDLRPVAPTLPITLPFNLVNPSNTPKRKGLLGLQSFGECYIHIESDSSFNGGGWFALKTISLGAFLDSLALVDA